MNELAFGLENLRYEPVFIKKRVMEITEKFEITHLLSRKTQSLSGGEKQKIAFLSILLMEPEVMLLDEPTAFLDPESAEVFINAFKKYIQDKTAVIVEHNMSYLKNIVNRNVNFSPDGTIRERNLPLLDWTQTLPKLQLQNIGEPILEIKNLSFHYPKQKKLLEEFEKCS